MILHGLSGVLRLRTDTNDANGLLRFFERVLQNLHGSEMKIMECLSCPGCDIVGSIAREEEKPEIPIRHWASLSDNSSRQQAATANEYPSKPRT
jgi:hypothetical protein